MTRLHILTVAGVGVFWLAAVIAAALIVDMPGWAAFAGGCLAGLMAIVSAGNLRMARPSVARINAPLTTLANDTRDTLKHAMEALDREDMTPELLERIADMLAQAAITIRSEINGP
jgi:hypothetical protein